MIQCPHCGASRVHASADSRCEVCGAAISSIPQPDGSAAIPWEQNGNMNLFKALFTTVGECLTHPFRFFGKINAASSLYHALLFGLVTGSIGILFDVMWQKSMANAWEALLFEGMESGLSNISINKLLFAPFILVMHIFLLSLYVHGLLILTKAKHTTFRSTVILISYIQSASIMSILPGLGNVIAPIWAFVILIIGINCIHKTAKLRTVITLLLPFIILGLFTTFVVIGALTGSYIVSVFFKEIFPFFR